MQATDPKIGCIVYLVAKYKHYFACQNWGHLKLFLCILIGLSEVHALPMVLGRCMQNEVVIINSISSNNEQIRCMVKLCFFLNLKIAPSCDSYSNKLNGSNSLHSLH